MGIVLANNTSFGNSLSITQGAFSLLNIPNLDVWLEASYKVYERTSPLDLAENNDPVARWVSRPSESNFNAASTSALSQPIYKTSEIGFNKPFLNNASGANTNAYLLGSRSASSGTVGASAFIVVRALTATPASTTGTGLWFSGANTARYPDTDGKINEGILRVGLINDITPTKPLNQWQIYSVFSKTNDYKIYLGNELQHSTTTSTYNGLTTTLVFLNNTEVFYGSVAELIIFSRYITEDQRLTVLNYLSNKFSIAL